MALIGDDRNAARISQIDQIPQVQTTDNDTNSSCSICISDFAKNEIILILPCVHKFHRTCIQTWLSKNNTCPTCRESVFEDLDPVWNSDDSSDDSIDVDVAGIPLFHMRMNALGHGHMFDVSASDDSIASVDSDVSDASNESDLFSLHVPSIDSWGYQTSPSLADTLEMDAESGDSLNGMSDSSSVEETDAMNESQISVRSESEHSEQSDDGSENVVTISSDESSDSDVMLYDSSDNSD